MKKVVGNVKIYLLSLLAVTAMIIASLPGGGVKAATYIVDEGYCPPTLEAGDELFGGTFMNQFTIELEGGQTIIFYSPGESATVTEGTWAFSGYTYPVTDPTDPYALQGCATAHYTRTGPKYTITFKPENGEADIVNQYVKGTSAATIIPANPTKPSTAQKNYTFAGWTPNVVDVTSDATYTAQYTESTRQYTITWLNDDGSRIDTTQVNYGDTPTHADATKRATGQYSYTFSGWIADTAGTTGAAGGIVPVTNDATYKATFTEKPVQYTIRFVDEDGTELYSNKFDYNTNPTYGGNKTPSKAETDDYTYAFDGWVGDGLAAPSTTLLPVTGDTTYTAHFKETKKEKKPTTYTVNFDSNGGTGSMAAQVINRDTDTALSANTFTKDGYDFNGWELRVPTYTAVTTFADKATVKNLAEAGGSVTLAATWKAKAPQTYTVSFAPGEGTGRMADQTINVGVATALNANAFTREGYDFNGWTTGGAAAAPTTYADGATVKDIAPAGGSVTLTATWKAKPTDAPTGPATPGPATPSPVITLPVNPEPTATPVPTATPEPTATPTPTPRVKEKIYNITYIVDGKENGNTGNPSQYKEGEGAKINKIVYKDGFEFVGWFNSAVGGKEVTSISKKSTGDITLYARFDEVDEDDDDDGEIEYIPHDDDLPDDGIDAYFGKLFAKMVKYKKTSITIEWQKIKGADGYDIYGSRCNSKTIKRKYKFEKSVGPDVTTYKAKNLREGTYYKYYVEAYKIVDGKKQIITRSVLIHGTTINKKYGVASKIKANKKEITLKVGEKFQLTGTEISKKPIRYHRPVNFESSNTKVAKVSRKTGKITAKKPGTCKIWVYAQNGVYTTVTVKVVQ